MKVKVYVEGGGDRKALRAQCRRGFRKFFSQTALQGKMPRVIACGGRGKTFDRFRHALANASHDETIVMLVDSETLVTEPPWSHLKKQDGWNCPDRATEKNAHLMVQCMEAWFLADKDTLAVFFGQGFNREKLPRKPTVEEVPKADLEKGLKEATRECAAKGPYNKGRHSFEILARLDAERILEASTHAKRLVADLLEMASA